MKKLLLSLTFAAGMFVAVNAQTVNVSSDITTNTTWTSNNIYLLQGWIYVRAGATLTIEPGTIVKGENSSQGALIIERDAKIYAQGTAQQPIIFTSDKPVGQRSYGDWGGVIICGRAACNLPANSGTGTAAGEGVIEGGVGSIFGGGATPNDQDSSGVLSYVRIEFGGIPFQPNNEINGLTCGAVGSKTKIDHVQVSFAGDDAVECFGGTVNLKNFICYRNWDDDFDTDNGYRGMVQYGLSVRDPQIADQSGSNGFESDNDATGTTNTPVTHPIYSNVTIVGPYANSSTINSLYKRALHIRRNSATSVYNSVFIGYPYGLYLDGDLTQANATSDFLQFRNNVLCQMDDTLVATSSGSNPNNVNTSNNFNINTWFNTTGYNNQQVASPSTLMLTDVNYQNPNAMPMTGSPLLSGADFTNSNLQNPFFTPVAFKGAFDNTNDWTACWANWDPQNQAYSSANYYCNVGVEEVENKVADLKLMPNPVNDNANLQIELTEAGDVTLEIVDLTGKVVYTEVRNNMNKGVQVISLNAAELTNGIYFVNLRNGATNNVVKMVVQH